MINKFIYETKLGNILICDNGKAITELKFTKEKCIPKVMRESALSQKAYNEIIEFFEGKRKVFDFPIEPSGTEFQKKVWNALKEIPYGETRTYKDIAIAIGKEKAVRAVGGANNKNPIHVVVPCHRVIGIKGDLVGYAAGIDIKKELLNLEREMKMK